jgi:hypothetical protein
VSWKKVNIKAEMLPVALVEVFVPEFVLPTFVLDLVEVVHV